MSDPSGVRRDSISHSTRWSHCLLLLPRYQLQQNFTRTPLRHRSLCCVITPSCLNLASWAPPILTVRCSFFIRIGFTITGQIRAQPTYTITKSFPWHPLNSSASRIHCMTLLNPAQDLFLGIWSDESGAILQRRRAPRRLCQRLPTRPYFKLVRRFYSTSSNVSYTTWP